MTPTTTTAHQQAHDRLMAFLGILLQLAPSIAAPFVPAGQGQAALAAEAPIAQALGQALAASGQAPAPAAPNA